MAQNPFTSDVSPVMQALEFVARQNQLAMETQRHDREMAMRQEQHQRDMELKQEQLRSQRADRESKIAEREEKQRLEQEKRGNARLAAEGITRAEGLPLHQGLAMGDGFSFTPLGPMPNMQPAPSPEVKEIEGAILSNKPEIALALLANAQRNRAMEREQEQWRQELSMKQQQFAERQALAARKASGGGGVNTRLATKILDQARNEANAARQWQEKARGRVVEYIDNVTGERRQRVEPPLAGKDAEAAKAAYLQHKSNAERLLKNRHVVGLYGDLSVPRPPPPAEAAKKEPPSLNPSNFSLAVKHLKTVGESGLKALDEDKDISSQDKAAIKAAAGLGPAPGLPPGLPASLPPGPDARLGTAEALLSGRKNARHSISPPPPPTQQQINAVRKAAGEWPPGANPEWWMEDLPDVPESVPSRPLYGYPSYLPPL